MKKDTIGKNFIFQILYQIVILVLPMVTAPYLTRTLGDYNLGVYTYTYSIAYYFVIFAMLGISRHGQRIVAQRKSDEIALRKTFWSLYFIHFVVSVISLLVFVFFSFFSSEYNVVFLIQAIYVGSALFDVTWLFYGLENFRSVVIKNAIIKVLEVVLIFALVKSNNDLIIYTIIVSSSFFIGHLIMFSQAIFLIKPIKFSKMDAIEHIKPLLLLFIVVVASSLYTIFDKTLLGILSTKENLAYYEYSNKIINIPKTIIAVIGTVLFPRSCACFAQNDIKGMKKYFKYSVWFTYFIGFASILGLICISDLLVELYYGLEFIECGKIIKYLSPAIIIVGFGDIIRTQMILPMKKDFQFAIIQIINAIINIVISVFLIPIYGVYGAIIGTLSAEVFGLITQIFICRKYIDFKIVLLSIVPFSLASIAMSLSIQVFKLKFNSSWLHLVLQITLGACAFLIVVFICFIMFKKTREEIKNFYTKFRLRRRLKNEIKEENN